MKLLKPAWVSHDEKPIFSIDIHPDGSRFATGGQGDSSGAGKVIIWNMEPVRDADMEDDQKVPKILCQMDNHLACVNCVRWSNDGKYLASGGDDKFVMIWQTSRYGGQTSSFGCNGKMLNYESWRICVTLSGHSGDVLGLAWSPHNLWLASCSVDNNIIIWNALKFPEIVATLKGHSGMVKGLTWDPIGTYLASQSDDKSIRVWRTYDWKEETCITKPFSECGGTTHMLRLDWSPDGEYLVTAHAMNNSGPTAQIVERAGWKTNRDFVGHRKAITCVRFSPCVMVRNSKEGEKTPSQHHVVCAVGSKDRSVSIWATHLKRPVIVMHDLFTSAILDMSWSSDGMEMMCCSWDGTIAYFGFNSTELGNPVSNQEKVGRAVLLASSFLIYLIGALYAILNDL
ncbi:hypothetical protein HELRODRAFT_64173 [Helobdella robusta]|uniref:CAF1B/HIR1 beta-propeller domain-containing protein n=1 Tax=Helobdella robusta TaxID=6412 RepID=T1FXQ8_HELRO|nr:hypothetical protein HELRODRAFT_64173 [Helobdella robusta]ESO06634.1 hypothetical protein HELRODRAFT_64173 [Helobdella robusta]